MIKFHGLTNGPIIGNIRTPFYLAHTLDLAEDYADLSYDSTDSPTLVAVVDHSTIPLTINTPEEFIKVWTLSKAETIKGPLHPNQMDHFAKFVHSLGYDSIVINSPAFDGEIGYREVAGRIGEPQTIILDSKNIRIL